MCTLRPGSVTAMWSVKKKLGEWTSPKHFASGYGLDYKHTTGIIFIYVKQLHLQFHFFKCGLLFRFSTPTACRKVTEQTKLCPNNCQSNIYINGH